MTGTIRTLRVDKGFGFIKDDKGQEYFFHQSAIYGEGIADLREGDTVEFEVGRVPRVPEPRTSGAPRRSPVVQGGQGGRQPSSRVRAIVLVLKYWAVEVFRLIAAPRFACARRGRC